MHKTWKKIPVPSNCIALSWIQDIFVFKKIFERRLNLPCLNSPAENKDEKGVKKWGEYFPV